MKLSLRSVLPPFKGQRLIALGHHRFEWLTSTPSARPATGETVWYLSDGVSKPLFAGLLAASAEAVGAGPFKRVVQLLDNAAFHTRPNLAVPDGIGLICLLRLLPRIAACRNALAFGGGRRHSPTSTDDCSAVPSWRAPCVTSAWRSTMR